MFYKGDQGSIITRFSPWRKSGGAVYFTDGNVGIGTNNPTEDLHIDADQPGIKFTDTAGDSVLLVDALGSDYGFIFRADGSSNNVVMLDTGNVGVGTTAPGALLEVQAAAGSAGDLRLTTAELTVVDGDVLGRVDFQAPLESSGTDAILVAASIWAEADAAFSASDNSTELVFATAASETATEKMRLTSDGLLGIGTSTPSENLHIDADQPGIKFTDTAGDSVLLVDALGSDYGFIFRPDGSANTMVMTDTGNVGIGVTAFGTSAVGVLGITGDGTVPSTSPAGMIQIFADDSSDGATNATLALRTEQAVEVIGTFTASHKLKIWINGVEYWIQLDAV